MLCRDLWAESQWYFIHFDFMIASAPNRRKDESLISYPILSTHRQHIYRSNCICHWYWMIITILLHRNNSYDNDNCENSFHHLMCHWQVHGHWQLVRESRLNYNYVVYRIKCVESPIRHFSYFSFLSHFGSFSRVWLVWQPLQKHKHIIKMHA